MALTNNWVNKIDEIDDVLAEDINEIAEAVIALENKKVVAPVTSVNGKTGTVNIGKSDVGLENVDNTSDLDKPISTLTQRALDGKLDVEIGYEDEIDTYVGESVKTYIIVDYARDIPEEDQGQFDQYYLIFIPRRHNLLGSLDDIQYKIDSYGMSVREASYLNSDGYSWSEWQSFESAANKVTAIDKNVTDEQYPSAKAVWDGLKGKLDVIRGYADKLDTYQGNGQLYYIVQESEGANHYGFNPYYLFVFGYGQENTQIKLDGGGIYKRKYQYFEGMADENSGAIIPEGWRWSDWVGIVDFSDLRFDPIPTEGSSNFITSGAVFDSLGNIDEALEEIIAIQDSLMGVSE